MSGKFDDASEHFFPRSENQAGLRKCPQQSGHDLGPHGKVEERGHAFLGSGASWPDFPDMQRILAAVLEWMVRNKRKKNGLTTAFRSFICGQVPLNFMRCRQRQLRNDKIKKIARDGFVQGIIVRHDACAQSQCAVITAASIKQNGKIASWGQ